jgi:hypothetical protein
MEWRKGDNAAWYFFQDQFGWSGCRVAGTPHHLTRKTAKID